MYITLSVGFGVIPHFGETDAKKKYRRKKKKNRKRRNMGEKCTGIRENTTYDRRQTIII